MVRPLLRHSLVLKSRCTTPLECKKSSPSEISIATVGKTGKKTFKGLNGLYSIKVMQKGKQM